MGSDVYLPIGRVYGTCGYFPMMSRSNFHQNQDDSTLSSAGGISKRDMLETELRRLDVRYQDLQSERDNLNDNESSSSSSSFDHRSSSSSSSNKKRDAETDTNNDEDNNTSWSPSSLLNAPFIRKMKLTKQMM